MNQAMFSSVNQKVIKTQIIKQIRELDWSREHNAPMILLSLHNLEISFLAHACEAEKFSALKNFNYQVFKNLQTQNKFNEFLQMYAELMPARAIDMANVLSAETDNKTFDEELEGADFDGYFELDDSVYNPLAAAHNDMMGVENALSVLAAIERNMNLDWVADIAAAPKPFVEVVMPSLEPQKPTAKKPAQNAVRLPLIGKVFGMIVVALAAAAIMVLVPPAIPFITALFATSVFAGIIMHAGDALGNMFDYARKKFSRQQKISAASQVVIEDISEKQPVKIPGKQAPQNDNIHEDPALEKATTTAKTPVAATLFDSKHSLFHVRKENPVEPKRILVRSILSYR